MATVRKIAAPGSAPALRALLCCFAGPGAVSLWPAGPAEVRGRYWPTTASAPLRNKRLFPSSTSRQRVAGRMARCPRMRRVMWWESSRKAWTIRAGSIPTTTEPRTSSPAPAASACRSPQAQTATWPRTDWRLRPVALRFGKSSSVAAPTACPPPGGATPTAWAGRMTPARNGRWSTNMTHMAATWYLSACPRCATALFAVDPEAATQRSFMPRQTYGTGQACSSHRTRLRAARCATI